MKIGIVACGRNFSLKVACIDYILDAFISDNNISNSKSYEYIDGTHHRVGIVGAGCIGGHFASRLFDEYVFKLMMETIINNHRIDIVEVGCTRSHSLSRLFNESVFKLMMKTIINNHRVGIVGARCRRKYFSISLFNEYVFKLMMETIIDNHRWLALPFRNAEIDNKPMLNSVEEEKNIFYFSNISDGGNDKFSLFNIFLLILFFYLFFIEHYLTNYTIKNLDKVIFVVMLTTFRHTVF